MSYRYGFQGQERDDELKGSGNHYTTLWRQYDPRLGRWMSVDPKANELPWESPYISMGDNPILKIDPKGDKWGKPGDKKSEEKNKAQAEKLKTNLGEKQKEYQQKYDDLADQINSYQGDKSSDEFMGLMVAQNEAFAGVLDMKNAQNEIDALGKDDNYYYFKQYGADLAFEVLRPKVDKNKDGTYSYGIPYVHGFNAFGTKAHETKHAAQFAAAVNESSYNAEIFNDRPAIEIQGYRRQYFADPSSLSKPVNSYKDINEGYIHSFKDEHGHSIYGK